MSSDFSRSSDDGELVQHLEFEMAAVRDELKQLRHEFDGARSEYIRHMTEDCGALAAELENTKEAVAQFFTALQRADQPELRRLTQRISELMTGGDGRGAA